MFCTCSYGEFDPRKMAGIPVQTSNGRPRFRLPYILEYNLQLLYPDRSTMGWKDRDRFAGAYATLLGGSGVAVIRRAALAIRTRAGAGDDVPLVLLCFENLTRPGKWCHRTIFAAWWEAQTGERVPELGGVRIPEIRAGQGSDDDTDPVLF